MKIMGFSAVAFKDGKSYSAWCPDIDVASQGGTLEKSLSNLKEAISLHLECLSPTEMAEVKGRQGTRITTTLEIPLPEPA